MKLQYLFLPLILWALVVYIFFSIPPTSLPIVLCFISIITAALFVTLRIFIKTRLPLILSGGLYVFLLSSVLSGFSFINLILITAITILVSLQITSH
ncbi:MAG: hypothetical protein WA061_07055 [Microgenomates group bacterium]